MICCKLCGKQFEKGGSHFFYKHKISIVEYIQEYENIDILSYYENGSSAKQIIKIIKERTAISLIKQNIFSFLRERNIVIRNTSEAIKEWSKKRNGPWNKGLTKFDHPSILAYAESRRGKNNPVFKIKDKEKWLLNCRKAFANRKTFDYVSSSLETTMAKVFIKLGIEYQTQFNIGNYFYDFLLPEQNFIIEINGTYWHCDPRVYNETYYNARSERTAQETWVRDEQKKMVAETAGYVVLYIWEKEIKSKTVQELQTYVTTLLQNKDDRKSQNG